jgi:hypothetical protein
MLSLQVRQFTIAGTADGGDAAIINHGNFVLSGLKLIT